MKPPIVSLLTAKAVGLLRSHYVYTARLVATGFSGSGRIPAFVWDHGIFDTHTGARVLGFGRKTYSELLRKKLLSRPAEFYVLRKSSSPDRVYTLSPKAAEVIVLAAVIRAIKEITQ